MKLKAIEWSKALIYLFALTCVAKLMYSLTKAKTCVESDGINEYLVNYQGGFVRRGLAGELLLILYQWTECNIGNIIRGLSVLFIIALALSLWKLMRNKGLSPILAFVPVSGISLYLFHFNYAGCRKDPLLLLFVIAAYWCVKQLWQTKKLYYLLFLNVCLGIGVMLHEAFVFFSFPIVLFSLTAMWKTEGKSTFFSLIRTLLCLFPAIVVFLVCITHSGEVNLPNIIWKSWQDYFQKYDRIAAHTDVKDTLSVSIKSLAWTLDYAIKYHIKVNFLSYSWGLPSWLYWMFFPIAYYHLMMNPNVILLGMQKRNSQYFNRLLMSNVIITSFICLIPMFTILSCDFSRTFVFLSISSIAAYCIIPHEILKNCWINVFDSFSRKADCIEMHLEKHKTYNKAFICLIAIPACGFGLTDAILSSVIGTPIGLFLELIERGL